MEEVQEVDFKELSILKTKRIIKIIIAVTVSLISVFASLFLFFIIYKNGMTVESILSLLLAFFSIFISIFFYFKADETSSDFYKQSYTFMKQQSNLLGRIDSKFGEKFDNLLYRLDHIGCGQLENATEIHAKTEETSEIIKKVLDELQGYDDNTDHEVISRNLKQYIRELDEKSSEYFDLMQNIENLRREVYDATDSVKNITSCMPITDSEEVLAFFSELSDDQREYVVNQCSKRIQKSNSVYRIALKYGLCNKEGLTSERLKSIIEVMRRRNI